MTAPLDPAGAWADVALDVPVDATFTYRVPLDLDRHVLRGVRVLVPYRSGARSGLVVGRRDAPPDGIAPERVRPISDVIDDERLVPEAPLALTEWISRYYQAPIGECVRLAIPAGAVVDASTRVAAVPGAASPDDPMLAALVDALRRIGRPVAPGELLALVLGARHHHLTALEAQGVLRYEYGTSRERVRARTIDRITLVDAEPSGRLGERQLEVLAFLKEHGDTTDAELRELFGTPRNVLRTLADRGAIALHTEEIDRDPFAGRDVRAREHDPALTPEQQAALAIIDETTATGGTVLVHGVTGSGKTEVYLRAIRAMLARGRRAIVLLPEIALTPQFVGVFRSALGEAIAVQHSGLSPGERYDQWRRIRRGDVRVVIGARSALFAPMDDPGLIVVDEEHDTSFKQDSGVRYHARDAAVMLGHQTGATVLLGSATPSLESLRNVDRGRYRYVRLAQRVASRPMPRIELLDMREHPADPEAPVSRWVSPPLQAAVQETVAAGEQAILFLNRRGFAPVIQCRSCGETLDCVQCDVSLTYHRRGHVARCHYCGLSVRVPDTCPTCGDTALEPEGVGTQQVERLVEEAFVGIRVGRLDADSARGRGLLDLLDAFRRHDLDVLIGTQMVTKGHDFPGVTLVGILNADQSLRFPDFRSGERTFQLLTQAAGRAGRGEVAGRVLVQTYNPDHFVLRAVVDGDLRGWIEHERHFRERVGYPPEGYMAAVRVDGPEHGDTWGAADDIAEGVRRMNLGGLVVLGPVDAPLARLRGRYRVHVTLRAPTRGPVHRAVAGVRSAWSAIARRHGGRVRVALDIDPQNLL